MRTPFKMKSSPAKGKLDNFFKGLGKKGTEARQTKQKETNEGGLTNFEKRQAERATQRKTGESKFKTDVKTKRKTSRANKRATSKADKKSTYVAPNPKDEIKVKTKNNLTLGGNKNKDIKSESDIYPPSYGTTANKSLFLPDDSESFLTSGNYARNINTGSIEETKVKGRVTYKEAYKNADKKKYPTQASFTTAAKAYNNKKKK